MATFGRCCCGCEGCTRGQLDEWLNDFPNSLEPELWRFTNGTYPNFIDFDKLSPICSSDCENGKLFVPQDIPPTPGIFAPWAFWYRYRCQQDIDGDLYCKRTAVYLSAKVNLFPGLIPRIRVFRGKIYNNCNESNPEVCRYLAVATLSANWEIWSATYNGPGGVGFVPCGSIYDYPDVEDIPHPSTWVFFGGTRWDSTDGAWTFGPASFLSGAPVTGTMNVNRVRTVGNLTEDKVVAGGIDWGIGFDTIKHQPTCCTYWDCDLTDLDCSAPASYQISIGGPFTDPSPQLCGFGVTTSEAYAETANIRLDGGDWFIYDA